MTSFIFNTGIPATNNDPSADQPDMLTNNISADGILAVDHVGYNSAGSGAQGSGGHHLQVTYDSMNTPVAQIDPGSTDYTAVGIADASHPQRFYRNSQGIFPISSVRAFGKFSLTSSPTITYSYNIASIAFTFPATFNITLTTNSVFGNNPIILLSSESANRAYSYSFTGGVLTVTASSLLFPQNIHVAFLQI